MEKSHFLISHMIFLIICLMLEYNYLVMAATNNITTDQSSLLSLKEQITSDPHKFLSNNWSSSSSNICEWRGVTCGSRHARVAALKLSNMDLAGTIPPHLGNLSFLVSLDLSSNYFHGNLPHELSQLQRLQVLNLTGNNLSGEIPSWLGSLHKLGIFLLKKNSFTGFIPPSIFNLSNLEELRLSFNSLEGSIPKQIGNLGSLKILTLGYNQLSGSLPIEIFNISSLERISLFNNTLSDSLPDYIMSSHLQRLRTLDLSNNRFSGVIPPSLFINSTNLEDLWLSFNSLQGTIPKQIGNLGSLKTLRLGYNQLSGSLPIEIFNISSLEIISLEENIALFGGVPYNACDNLRGLRVIELSRIKLNGPILSILSNCSQLQVLDLAHTNFGGVIPEEIGKLKSLQELFLAYTNLTGKIPKEIYNISTLEFIGFTSNSISDSLPENICDSLPKLNTLLLGLNRLKGQIPSNWSRCSELEGLELVQNELHGLLPKELSSLKKLGELYLAGNNFGGRIPSEFGNTTMLTILYLDGNKLIGTIPEEFGNLYNLERLYLGDNKLRGPMPMDSLANCKNLIEFSVSGNPLISGVLPVSVGNLSRSIQKFEVSDCQIKGNIPDTIGNLTNLIDLDLSWNGLSGLLPLSIKFLQKLQSLNLERNNLNGAIMIDRVCGLQSLSEVHMQYNKISESIPECLGNLRSLRRLSFSSNELNGSVPVSLWSHRYLLELNLSKNFLSGSLPPEFGNMKAATLIDMSMNNISGSIPLSIGYLLNLQVLNMAYNKIQGSIPEAIGEMVSLESMDLSHNALSGLIPNILEKLRYLKHFDVSFNDLSGEIPNGGSFQNFTSESFAFNRALCGEQRFRVPPCPSRSNKKKIPRIVIVLVGITAFLGALSSVFVYLRYRKKITAKNQLVLLPHVRTHERISHDELVRATEGYHEKNLLGKGSFGSVYKGILGDGRIVAVKVFNLQFEKASTSFDVECMVLRELRHRNLVKVITSCSSPNFKELVLEFMTNGNLEQWLHSEYYFLNFMQRLDVMIDVACALNYLHSGYSSSIVHCDLKPSNILLDEDMVAHVSDFGIAKLLGHEDSMTYTQTLATLGYLAPEYGLEGTVSTKCDVYSYGILLMEVFTRKKPDDDMFEGNLNLRDWVHYASLNSLASVIDANLLTTDGMNSKKELEHLSSIMEVALSCTKESPKERCTMADVIAAMKKIKLQLQPHERISPVIRK